MFYLNYFALNKHKINTVTYFIQSYIQTAFLPVTVLQIYKFEAKDNLS